MRTMNLFSRLQRLVGSGSRAARWRQLRREERPRAVQTRSEILEDRALLATLVVTTPNDVISSTDAALSLREALLIANDDSGATSFHGISSTDSSDTITFAPGLNGVPIVLTRTGANENAGQTGDLDIRSNVTIRGAGAGLTIIDGNGTDRVFDVHSADAALIVTLEGLTIRNGRTSEHGGGVWNSESLFVRDSVITDNKAVQNGGGLYNQSGHVELIDTDVTHNEAGFEHFGTGGGIHTQLTERLFGPMPTLLITGGEISFNTADRGGGIYNDGDHVELDEVRVANNAANLEGGGIRTSGNSHLAPATLIVRDSEISENEAGDNGGGIYIDNDNVSIQDSMITGNVADSGGGIAASGFGYYDSAVVLTISGSTIANNEATDGNGGGLLLYGLQTTIESTTVANNKAIGAGGGLSNSSGFVEILTSIIRDNVVEGMFEEAEGGGIAIYGGDLIVERSTITRNTARGHDGGAANGGGVYQGRSGFVELFQTTISDNVAEGGSSESTNGGDGYGGGLYSDGNVFIYASTFEGNSAIGGSSTLADEGEGEGGGVWNRGALEIENSTFSGNAATYDGGGIYTGVSTNVQIRHATITLNRADSDGNGTGTGGGISLGTFDQVLLTSSIIAGNVRGAVVAEVAADVSGGLLEASSFNLIGDAATSGGLIDESADPAHANIVGNAGTGTITLATVLNSMLADNGNGITRTHALVAMSPAIDNGSVASDPRIDQRFFYRFDGLPDIGAFEFGANSIVEVDELDEGLVAFVTLQFPDMTELNLVLEGSAFDDDAILAALFEGTTEGIANDGDDDNLDEIATELIELNLVSPDVFSTEFVVTVRLNSSQRSLGQIEEQTNNTPGILDLSPFGNGQQATSFFDVFLVVDIDAGVFFNSGRNAAPLRLQSVVTEKPIGIGDEFQMVGSPVELRDEGDALLATIIDMRVVPRPLFDFGDAPNRTVNPTKSFPVTLADGGAHHLVNSAGPILGDDIDREVDGQPSVDANGDDLNPLAGADDEDGIHFTTPLVAGQMATVEVTVTKAGAAAGSPAGFLNARIDFSGDGVWNTHDERIFTNEPVVVGVNVLSFPVSEFAVKQDASFARFQLTSYQLPFDSMVYGFSYDGEVEDVQVGVEVPPRDFGDAPAPYPTMLGRFADPALHFINEDIRLGALIDEEPDGQASTAADGDDSHGLDDEDGVAFLTSLVVGQEARINVTASAPGFLNAWIDFVGDGFWNGTWIGFGNDQIAHNLEFTIADFSDGMGGTLASATKTVTFVVPEGPLNGAETYARFRFSTENNLTPFDDAPDGEVEDYRVTIQSFDFGDAPDTYGTTLDFDGTTREGPHHQRTGPSLNFSDAEANGQPTGGVNPATGDDDNGFDDENGVFFNSFVQNGMALVSVYPTAPGFLNAWFDFGADGSFDQVGDHIFNDVPVVAGFNLLSFPVGSFGLDEGQSVTTFVRFRIASDAADVNDPYGFADSGEVEDYGLIIEQPLLPDAQVGDTFIFNVLPGRRRGDPAIAIGYDYVITDNVGDGQGRITELLLPSLPVGDDEYTLHLPDGMGGFQTTVAAVLAAGENYDLEATFTDADGNTFIGVPGGFASLRILGIETAAMLDVEDDLAFVFDFEISGTDGVTYNIEMTAIPEAVFVDNAADFSITEDNGAQGVLDAGDIVTWFGLPGTADDEPGLRFGTTAFATIQSAINYVEANDFSHLTDTQQSTIRVAPGTFIENLVISGTQIIGSGAGVTVIDGNGNGHVLEVMSSADAIVEGVTIQNGNATAGPMSDPRGGGVFNRGDLTIRNSTISGNTAAAGGGGVFNSGSLTIENSTISGNQAGANGGGVYNYIDTFDGDGFADLTITNSTISNNTALGEGGGISNYSSTNTGNVTAQVTITHSTISGNSAANGGGISNESEDFNNGLANALLTIHNSTISGNTATGHGGGLLNDHDHESGTANSQVTLVNVTITGNRADSDAMGGGRGGGIRNFLTDDLAVTLHNSIVAGNDLGVAPMGVDIVDDIFGTNVNPQSSFNLIGDPVDCGGLFTGDGRNNIAGQGMPLAVIPIHEILDINLADNGGPTRTHRLVYNSLAIDSGSNVIVADADLTTDQRGLPRVMSGDGDFVSQVDRGAYERGFSLIAQFPLTAAELTLEILDPDDPPSVLIVHPDGPSAVVLEYYGPNAGDARFITATATDEISVQMVQLMLSGETPFGSGTVTLNPTMPTFGKLTESHAGTLPGVLEVPPHTPMGSVDSFFDVFVQIDLPSLGLHVHNETPVRVSAELTDLNPPPGVTFERPDVGDPIPLLTEGGDDSMIRIRRVRHTPVPFDFGDAPDPNYPTLLVSDGARHVLMGPRLGPSVDPDVDGMPTSLADGDDVLDFSDDENGVTFVVASLITSQTAATTGSVSIDLQNADPASNKLDAWIDFNQDGDWGDLGEQIFTSRDLGTTDGVQLLTFTIPADSGTNVKLGATYARFRLSTSGGLSPTGAARDGEVEDYRLTILEKNDFNPTVSGGPFDLAENSPNTTVVGAVSGADDDDTDGGLTFAITGGNTLGIFTINMTSGAISVQNNANLDREAISSVELTVQVSDNGPGDARTGTTSVTINITPVNDNSPIFTSVSSLEVAENTSTATVILDANATDADQPVQTVSFAPLTGPDAARFNINLTTGEITFVAPPNFEAPADVGGDNVYNITVTSHDDGSPQRTTTQDVTITVTDVEEGDPGVLQRIVYRFLSARDADVDFVDTLGGVTTTPFRGVTVINLLQTAPELVFQLPGTNDAAMLMNLGRSNDGRMQLIGPTFPDVQFSVIGTNSVSVNGGDGFDALTALSLDSRFATGATLTINGEEGHDTLNAGSLTRPVRLNGGNGHDALLGGSGNDTLTGGAGNDVLNGGRGRNTLHETLPGDAHTNLMLRNTQLTGLGTDLLLSLSRAILEGSAGNNRIDATAFSRGPVTLRGHGGHDTLLSGSNADELDGGEGDDSLRGNGGNDLLLGGAGSDFLFGGIGNDHLNGGDDGDSLWGEFGSDTIHGEGGNDLAFGGIGNDVIDGGEDSDTLLGEFGNDTLRGGTGNDGLSGGLGNDRLEGQDGNDTLLGNDGNDTVFGGDQDDILLGGNDNDSIDSGSGADTINGGGGTNTFTPPALNDPLHDLVSEIDNAFTFNFNDLLP